MPVLRVTHVAIVAAVKQLNINYLYVIAAIHIYVKDQNGLRYQFSITFIQINVHKNHHS